MSAFEFGIMEDRRRIIPPTTDPIFSQTHNQALGWFQNVKRYTRFRASKNTLIADIGIGFSFIAFLAYTLYSDFSDTDFDIKWKELKKCMVIAAITHLFVFSIIITFENLVNRRTRATMKRVVFLLMMNVLCILELYRHYRLFLIRNEIRRVIDSDVGGDVIKDIEWIATKQEDEKELLSLNWSKCVFMYVSVAILQGVFLHLTLIHKSFDLSNWNDLSRIGVIITATLCTVKSTYDWRQSIQTHKQALYFLYYYGRSGPVARNIINLQINRFKISSRSHASRYH